MHTKRQSHGPPKCSDNRYLVDDGSAQTTGLRPCPAHVIPRAFTLIELLVVIAVVGILAGLAFSGTGVAEQSTALRSAQATLANALSATRSRALARGVPVALAVHDDPNNPGRYRRMIAIVEDMGTAPKVVAVFELPKHVYVLPHRARFTEQMREPGNWVGGSSGTALGSTRFLSPGGVITVAINSPIAERWEYALVTPSGTMSGGGSLIVGVAERIDAGPFPIRFQSPAQVRGLMVSNYGLARMINGRAGF